jgi:hypothetical protein
MKHLEAAGVWLETGKVAALCITGKYRLFGRYFERVLKGCNVKLNGETLLKCV